MKTLRSSKFIDLSYDEDRKLFLMKWKDETADMDNEEFKTEMTEYSNFFDLGGVAVLHDMKDMQFTITPDLQKWLDANINKKGVEAGVKSAAFVVSKDLFTSVSVEQTNEELNAKKIPMQYFDNIADAEKWLANL